MGSVDKFINNIWTLSPQRIWHSLNGRNLPGISAKEYRRIKRIPPKLNAEIEFFGKKLAIVDSASFLYMYHEIFGKEIYRFESGNKVPYIIDCGANIGMSMIYFKTIFPEARIICFEPDAETFKALKKNIRSFGLQNVELYNSGVAAETGEQFFLPDHSDGGHFIKSPAPEAVPVKTIRLHDFIFEQTDFLKIDIEGYETEVILSLNEKLSLVDRVFVEYHSYSSERQNLGLLLECLTLNGFRYYIQSVFEKRHPFNSSGIDSEIDMQLNISAVKKYVSSGDF